MALTLNEHHLLVPSMLPRDKPGLRLHDLRKTLTKKNNRRSRSSNDDLSNEGKVLLSLFWSFVRRLQLVRNKKPQRSVVSIPAFTFTATK